VLCLVECQGRIAGEGVAELDVMLKGGELEGKMEHANKLHRLHDKKYHLYKAPPLPPVGQSVATRLTKKKSFSTKQVDTSDSC